MMFDVVTNSFIVLPMCRRTPHIYSIMNSPCLRALPFVCEDNDNYDDVNSNDGSRSGVRMNADYFQENKMSNWTNEE